VSEPASFISKSKKPGRLGQQRREELGAVAVGASEQVGRRSEEGFMPDSSAQEDCHKLRGVALCQAIDIPGRKLEEICKN
jgi:hypothetical protein